jgi:hypothetical protein
MGGHSVIIGVESERVSPDEDYIFDHIPGDLLGESRRSCASCPTAPVVLGTADPRSGRLHRLRGWPRDLHRFHQTAVTAPLGLLNYARSWRSGARPPNCPAWRPSDLFEFNDDFIAGCPWHERQRRAEMFMSRSGSG